MIRNERELKIDSFKAKHFKIKTDGNLLHCTVTLSPWNYNTNRNNMLENTLLYAQLSLEVISC